MRRNTNQEFQDSAKMDFISNQSPQIAEMLALLGIKSIDELFSSIPVNLKLQKLTEDDGLSEFEGIQLMKSFANKNSFQNFESYLGAGCYEHHIPSLVPAITAKSEFLTSYTPYQPEASQGSLQAIFEFQSAVCALTGMDVSNASLYDGASACAEAVLMALRLQNSKKKVLVAHNIHPHYLGVVRQYLGSHEYALELLPFNSDGLIDITKLREMITNECALQYSFNPPTFLDLLKRWIRFFLLQMKIGLCQSFAEILLPTAFTKALKNWALISL